MGACAMQPKTQRERSWATYLTALGVPEHLNKPELPLLITEDDVLFTPDFGKKLGDVSVEKEALS